jgi:hypothetical protein
LLADHTDLFGIYGATESLPIAKVESHDIFTLKKKQKTARVFVWVNPLTT